MNWTKLLQNIKDGTFNTSHWELYIDNDSATWVNINPDITTDEQEQQEKVVENQYGQPTPDTFIDLLDALGFNAMKE